MHKAGLSMHVRSQATYHRGIRHAIFPDVVGERKLCLPSTPLGMVNSILIVRSVHIFAASAIYLDAHPRANESI